MHAATLHGSTRRNNDIQVLKGVCRVTVCTAGPGLQGHPIDFSNHFHLFGFNVQVLLFYVLFYFMLLEKIHAATLHGTTSLSILLSRVCCFVLFCFVCLWCAPCVLRPWVRTGRAGCPRKALDGEVCATSVSWCSRPRTRRYGISKYLRAGKWPENGRKMAGKWRKWPKLGKFQKNGTIPTPYKLYYLELPIIC